LGWPALGQRELGTLHAELTMNAAGVARAHVQQLPFKRHTTIVFDHSSQDHISGKNASPQHARQIIGELCGAQDRVAPDAASHFADLVNHLRGLSATEIVSVSSPGCGAFADALAACASQSCLAHLGNLINAGAAPESVYSSLSLVPAPEDGIVDSVASFIDRVPLHGLLPVSSMVQSYCNGHPECGRNPSVQRIIQSIVAKLPAGCRVGERFDEIEKTVIILKSVGNIANEQHSLPSILACIDNQHIPRDVKLAAINALRRKPCSQQRNDKISKLYRDHKEDVEVRIESFRQLMQCPSDDIVQNIVDALRNETINQVGSYVWSFLNTKRRSTNPGSYDLQNVLKRFHIPQRFDVDPRRFSRYYEFGYFDKERSFFENDQLFNE
uniref:Vitellogenin domain-containing protein n=1 Tax=Gongylonema pulchrum TaxID=637853 RepID=A0A183E785_9BILA